MLPEIGQVYLFIRKTKNRTKILNWNKSIKDFSVKFTCKLTVLLSTTNWLISMGLPLSDALWRKIISPFNVILIRIRLVTVQRKSPRALGSNCIGIQFMFLNEDFLKFNCILIKKILYCIFTHGFVKSNPYDLDLFYWKNLKSWKNLNKKNKHTYHQLFRINFLAFQKPIN